MLTSCCIHVHRVVFWVAWACKFLFLCYPPARKRERGEKANMPKSRRLILKCAAALYLSLSALSCPSAPQPHERSDQIRSACVVVLDELRPAGPVRARHMPSRLHFVICCCSGMAWLQPASLQYVFWMS